MKQFNNRTLLRHSLCVLGSFFSIIALILQTQINVNSTFFKTSTPIYTVLDATIITLTLFVPLLAYTYNIIWGKCRATYRKARPILFFLAVTFAVLQFIGLSMHQFDSLDFSMPNQHQFIITVLLLLGFSILFYNVALCYFLSFDYLAQAEFRPLSRTFLTKHPCIFAFSCITLAWTPWIIVYFPGSVTIDALSSILQILDIEHLSDHHPVLISWLLGNVFKLGRKIANDNIGIFSFILFQSLLSASIYSYIAAYTLSKTSSKKLFFMVIAYFSFITYFGGYAQAFVKDTIFSPIFALFVLYTTKLVLPDSTKTTLACCCLLGLLSCLLRHNALYATFPILIILPFIQNAKITKKFISLCVCIVVIVYYAIRILYFNVFQVVPGSPIEALSIPIQQIARYVRDYKTDVTADQQHLIKKFFPYEKLAKLYNPNLAQPVKRSFNTKQLHQIKLLLDIWYIFLKKHPRNHFEAAFANSYGYYSFTPKIKTRPQLLTYHPQSSLNKAKLKIKYFFPKSYRSIMLKYHTFFSHLPIISLFHKLPFYTWSFFIITAYLFYKRRWKFLIPTVPIVMFFLTCVASPVNGSVRYFLPIIAAFPNLLITLFVSNERVIS